MKVLRAGLGRLFSSMLSAFQSGSGSVLPNRAMRRAMSSMQRRAFGVQPRNERRPTASDYDLHYTKRRRDGFIGDHALRGTNSEDHQ